MYRKSERGNPYATDEVVKLNNFVLGKLSEEKSTKHILTFAEDEKECHRNFHKECFIEKSLNFSATITKVNLPKFKGLPQPPKTGKVSIKAIKKKFGLMPRKTLTLADLEVHNE